MNKPSHRLLYVIPHAWLIFRVDLSVLFGRHLPKLGIYSDLITTGTEDKSTDWQAGIVKLGRLSGGMVRHHVNTFRHILIQLIRADWSRYDAVQVRDLPLPASVAVLVTRWCRRPFIYWMSFPMPEGQMQLARERGFEAGLMRFLFPWIRGRVGRFLLYRWVLPRADHVFVQSDQMKADLISHGVTADRMTAVPMGVDVAQIAPGSVDPGIRDALQGKRVLIYLGRLERARRIETLFQMMSLLQPRVPDLVLLMVGDTEDEPHRERLHKLALDAGVADQVIWTGWVPIETAWGYVALSDVGLSPIPRGPILDCSSPTKIIEYLALGLPVVCNDNPDQAIIIESCGSGRCVPYTAEDFANAAVEMLNLSPDEREVMIRNGRDYVENHRDYRQIAQRVANAYRSVFKSGNPETAVEAS